MSDNLISIKGELSPVGWSVPDDLTLDEWYNAGESIVKANKMIGWVIGDWLNAGEYKLGEMGNVYEEASRTTGLGIGRLQNLKSLAKKVEISRRSEILSIKHHIQIASYSKTPDKQTHWLSLAEENKWSVRQLQQEIKDAETPKHTCADCGYIADQQIWHCPTCNAHWFLSQTECPNCTVKEVPTLPDDELTPKEEEWVKRMAAAINSRSSSANGDKPKESIPQPSFDDLMEEADTSVSQMDKSDQEARIATPKDIGPYSLIFTAETAIESGLKMLDWQTVAEGLVMLKDAKNNEAIKQAYKKEVADYQGQIIYD